MLVGQVVMVECGVGRTVVMVVMLECSVGRTVVIVVMVECSVGRTCGDGGVMEPGADINIYCVTWQDQHSQHRTDLKL